MIRFPRTWQGWVTLFWLALRRCPTHHSTMPIDLMNGSRMCLRCSRFGAWPDGILLALRQNAMNYRLKRQAEDADVAC